MYKDIVLMKILSGTSNPTLSKSISKHLKTKLVNTNIKKFADGEIYVEINENIRGNSVFVVQSSAPQLMIILWNFYCVLMLLEDLLQKVSQLLSRILVTQDKTERLSQEPRSLQS